MRDSDFCLFHAENRTEIARRGGEVSAGRRSVRERFREDAERSYESLIATIRQAVDSELTAWNDCPNCNHRVAHRFPDIRAQLLAIQLLLDQGYGKPPLSIRQEVDVPLETPPDGLSPEARKVLLVKATAELERRKAQTPEQRIEELETEIASARAEASNGRTAK